MRERENLSSEDQTLKKKTEDFIVFHYIERSLNRLLTLRGIISFLFVTIF